WPPVRRRVPPLPVRCPPHSPPPAWCPHHVPPQSEYCQDPAGDTTFSAVCHCLFGAVRCWVHPEYMPPPPGRSRSASPDGSSAPPDVVPVARERVQYSRHTSTRTPSLERISLRIWPPIICCIWPRCRSSITFCRLRMDISVTSKMFFSPTLTPREVGFSRCPL